MAYHSRVKGLYIEEGMKVRLKKEVNDAEGWFEALDVVRIHDIERENNTPRIITFKDSWGNKVRYGGFKINDLDEVIEIIC